MKTRFSKAFVVALALVGGGVWQLDCLQVASACGLDWSLPTNHFDGVDSEGYVSYWEKVGEVDCGDGLVLPLHISFSSKRDEGSPSPYLGQGWLLPLLESKFVQESEDRFWMMQPDGLNNLFVRDGGDQTVLTGSAGWKGEIKGNLINVWAPCGWKLTFNQGKIASMATPKGRKLDWVYEGGRVRELREGNATRLKVEYGTDGKVGAITLPDGRSIGFAQDKRPRVQVVGGQNVVAGVDSSLSALTLADGEKQTFTFGTDEKTLPNLRVEDGVATKEGDTVADPHQARLLSWNPQTSLIAKDGPWSYMITAARKAGENAAIGRTDAQGHKEYWFYDGPNGQETSQNADGSREVKTWFVSGRTAGYLRRIVGSTLSGQNELRQYSYDENGNLIRSIVNGVTKNFSHGRVISVLSGEKLLWKINYHNDGTLASIQNMND